ncbi:MAG: large conductance mechanosensitive channel protein MscL [Patescibacteria group bacterium]|nr:large conductance mechanosensitive channel protein MscL [Patescibacteria group bacterium]
MLKDFKQFILRGNVVDLAIGVVMGAAFTSVVNSLVKDILTPFIAAIFKQPDFSGLYFTLNHSRFTYGNFINSLVSLIIVSTAIYFFVVTPLNSLITRMRKEAPVDPATKKCPECLSDIPKEAKRCAYCTSQV